MAVKDILVKKVITLSPEMSAGEALQKLLEKEISGLPVVDTNNKLVGMFTEKSILRAILPSYVEKVGHFVYDADSKKLAEKVQRLSQIKVRDIMRKEVVTAGLETPLYEVARIMLIQKIRRVPVVDKDNIVLGIIARQDVLRALVKNKELGND
ncbi:MAG: CBS domain-containing protein [Candidatus Omnitrophica bacterium]|nr:CBS domain-containing protein [Candidatus Omnitrophota bacterium]